MQLLGPVGDFVLENAHSSASAIAGACHRSPPTSRSGPSHSACVLQEYAADYDLAEDEEIEQYYFSSAAGRARVVLGNRRYGEGGFISGGRRQVGGGRSRAQQRAMRPLRCCPALGVLRLFSLARQNIVSDVQTEHRSRSVARPLHQPFGYAVNLSIKPRPLPSPASPPQARPVVERKRSNKMGKAGEHAVVGAPTAQAARCATPNAGGGRKARPASASSTGACGSSTPGGGRHPLEKQQPGSHVSAPAFVSAGRREGVSQARFCAFLLMS